jgi:glycosyltransferase involved in cell wall biosynthesis
MNGGILQVFNRYLHAGGEEKSVDRIYQHLSEGHRVSRCFFDSAEWLGPGAPNTAQQVTRVFYNSEARTRFETALDASGAQIALFHNIYPVGSPSLYRAARDRKVPVIQYLHNFRPFSVGGTLFVNGRVCDDSLRGKYGAEVRAGVWQNSVLKSAVFALMLKMLHRSGWLRSVKTWIAISDFMRDRIVEAGLVPPERIHTVRHSWDAMPEAPPTEDAGYYLFLGRLVETKGVIPLLDAWDALRAQLGARTPHLQIAGVGPLEEVVSQRVSRNPCISHLGHIDRETKREALRRCRAVVVPSVWWEPLGLVVYEAYDFAKPVLAARSGGLTETVHPGLTGFLHAPGDVSSIVKDVLALEAASESSRISMGRNGREWLLREASPRAWQRRFASLL